ncbi:DUF6265 family protein [Niabella ginsengisoli]|uniref:DUF6265 family protein n=1 Tax=Niabella ginsengisoli TaxID=522298 RepID=A0ABS9SGU5_9BACT|nr:DUF6265 family protein [Niabella ginsengisoli]MCH5597584.1 DUF6265 family protein [Niabella ginsengisoli]
MNQRLFILSIMTFLFVSCNENKQETQGKPLYAKIKTAGWLSGNWHHSSEEGNATEQWRRVNDSTYAAESFIIVKNDTVFYETMHLEQRAGSVYCIINAKEQNKNEAVSFKLTSSEPDILVFENPQHDFPTKIVYNKIGEDSLFAEISGTINGKERKEGFPFKKLSSL